MKLINNSYNSEMYILKKRYNYRCLFTYNNNNSNNAG